MINPLTALTPADLRRWLSSKAPSATVGIAGDCTACVVAQWLSETLCATVTTTHTASWITPRGVTTRYRNPAWVTEYIWAIDDLPSTTGEHAITAAAALEILARMQRVEGVAA